MNRDAEQQTTCSAAEELLTAESLGILGEMESARLRRHLRSCPPCRSHQQLLRQFRTCLDLGQNGSLRPDPAIQQRLRSALLSRRRPLVQFLNRRVPLYQAMLGAAAAVFILFTASRLGPDIRRPTAPLLAPAGAEYTHVDSYEVMGKLNLLDAQSRGWDHTEDSLLIRFHPTNIKTTDSI